jgi:eukaryotic-like serine/threonine-protein kinase
MALAAGTRLGAYEILTLIGSGGMGEVYRARDRRLDRNVAIKVLPDSLAADSERLARFEREAKTLAALNHPNIAHIHGVEDSTGAPALVMELVEGPTLADRIAQGPLPLDEALAIARQLAEGLQAAHDQGIIHRDLKPTNIKVRDDGTVKILDFGLAKALETPQPSTVNATHAGTITTPAMLTGVGMIFGTAAYMSPEQAKGRPADKRSDVWAFGCVLYEMLTGKRAFEGDDVADTLANVLKAQPDWQTLSADVPPAVAAFLSQSLQKDRHQRVGDIAAASFALRMSPTPIVATPTPGDLRRRAVPVAIAGVLCAAIVAAVAWSLRPGAALRPAVVRFTIPLAPDEQFTAIFQRLVAISPDGARVAFVANNRLYLRNLRELDAAPIRGTEGVARDPGPASPVFSPDGEWVAFWQAGQIRKVPIAGGAPIVLCAIEQSPNGTQWVPGDAIVFSRGPLGIWRVSTNGGTPEVIAKPAPEGRAALQPQLLPGGRAVLYTLRNLADTTADSVVVQSLDGGAPRVVVPHGYDAQYLPTRHLAYLDAGTLYAVPFDLETMTATGKPVPLVEGVQRSLRTATAQFSVSSTGSLVFVPAQATELRTLVWVDRRGLETAVPAPPRAYARPRISPDGSRIVVEITAPEQDQGAWIWDTARASLTRLTLTARASFPIWSRDGNFVVFASNDGIQKQAVAGAVTNERLFARVFTAFPDAVSADGRWLLVDERVVESGRDQRLQWNVNIVSLGADHVSRPLLARPFNERFAELSPDGRWVAYQSNETGSDEIHVRPFPDVEKGHWQISTAGGFTPVWSPTGRELFYLNADGGLMSVAVQTAPTFSTAAPIKLFAGSYERRDGRTFDVAPDGQRFLAIKRNAAAEAPRMVVVEHWFEELERRVPVR